MLNFLIESGACIDMDDCEDEDIDYDFLIKNGYTLYVADDFGDNRAIVYDSDDNSIEEVDSYDLVVAKKYGVGFDNIEDIKEYSLHGYIAIKYRNVEDSWNKDRFIEGAVFNYDESEKRSYTCLYHDENIVLVLFFDDILILNMEDIPTDIVGYSFESDVASFGCGFSLRFMYSNGYGDFEYTYHSSSYALIGNIRDFGINSKELYPLDIMKKLVSNHLNKIKRMQLLGA